MPVAELWCGILGWPGRFRLGVAVVGSTAGEGVVFFGKELEHQLFRRHAHGQQEAVVAVVAAHVVLRLQETAGGDLDDFVSARACVDVFGGQPSVLFVEVGHGARGACGLVSLEQPCGCGRFRRLGHSPKIGPPRPTSRRARTTFVPWRFNSKNGKARATILCSWTAGRTAGCRPSGRTRRCKRCATANAAWARRGGGGLARARTASCTSISANPTAAGRFAGTAPEAPWLGPMVGLVESRWTSMAVDGAHAGVVNRADGTPGISLNVSPCPACQDAPCPTPFHAAFLDTGSPHHVEWVEETEASRTDMDLPKPRAPARHHEDYNAARLQRQRGGGRRRGPVIRTFERGVEAETLSCGTGVVAAALLDMARLDASAGQHRRLVRARGGTLEVKATRQEDGSFGDVWLFGAARRVFRGTWALAIAWLALWSHLEGRRAGRRADGRRPGFRVDGQSRFRICTPRLATRPFASTIP